MEHDMTQTALVLGGSGRFGRNMAQAFTNAGWQVRLFDRDHDDLTTAAAGADIIVNGWNPPYHRWTAEVAGLTQQVIAAARAAGSTVIVPGNVYVFGKDAPRTLTSETPHDARNPLGRVRIAMEAAFRDSGVQTIVLRAGDFLDTRASGNWFDMIIAAKVGKGRLVWPGDPDAAHAFAFLPDMARAAVALAQRRDRLPRFLDLPYGGLTLTGRSLAAAVARVTGRPVRLSRFNWWPLRLLSPVWPLARGILEMRYLWSKPHRLDGAALARLLPDHVDTPLDAAIASALQVQIDPDQPVARGGVAVAAQ